MAKLDSAPPSTLQAWRELASDGAVASRGGSETSLRHASRDALVARGDDTAHDVPVKVIADPPSAPANAVAQW